uniref:DNA-directed DNA polymerase n=1 Tax=Parastrongyloides trichosuri TaxID=131310 RepID=A0A0N4ZRL2_PARTI
MMMAEPLNEEDIGVLYAVLKYSSRKVVDVTKFDDYTLNIGIMQNRSSLLNYFKQKLGKLRKMNYNDDCNKWISMAVKLEIQGFIYPIPIKHQYVDFEHNVYDYTRYYVIINKASLFDTLFNPSLCGAVLNKCEAKLASVDFLRTYRPLKNEPIKMNKEEFRKVYSKVSGEPIIIHMNDECSKDKKTRFSYDYYHNYEYSQKIKKYSIKKLEYKIMDKYDEIGNNKYAGVNLSDEYKKIIKKNFENKEGVSSICMISVLEKIENSNLD